MIWNQIETLTGNDGTVLLAHWFEDDCHGYFGESRFIWITSGCYDDDDGWWFCDFTDREFAGDYSQKPTHWAKMPLTK